jgi:hypothetical protein
MKLKIGLLMLCPLLVQAGVIFSNFGPGMSYSSLRYSYDGDAFYAAWRFQATGSGALNTVTLPLSHQTPPAQTVFRLYNGTSSNFSAELESWTVSNLSASTTLVTLTSLSHASLTVGNFYWLSVSEPDALDGNFSLWSFNSVGMFDIAMRSNGGYAGYTPAFQLDSVDSPEPGTSGGLTVGVGLVWGVRRILRSAGKGFPTRT